MIEPFLVVSAEYVAADEPEPAPDSWSIDLHTGDATGGGAAETTELT